MVDTERHDDLAAIDAENRAAIAHVGRVAVVADDENDGGAAARTVEKRCIFVWRLALAQEYFFSGLETADESILRIKREALLLDDEVMQLVAEELSACVTAMTVVDAKEAAFRPLLILPVAWLGDVENNGDAIFVIIAHEALVGDGRVAADDSVPLDAALGRLLVRDNDSRARL